MSERESHELETDAADGAVVVQPRKSRVSKHFLRASVSTLGLGLTIIGVAGLVIWVARDAIATAALEAFLRSKGIAAAITVENLQLGTAQIRDLRLGPSEKPTLVAPTTLVEWHRDSKSGMIIIDKVQVDKPTVSIGVNKDGKVDFGALAPFMTPSTGPKRSVINGVTINQATVLADTHLGQAKARVDVWGGEALGWTGRADILAPAAMMRQGSTTEPLRAGFSMRQIPARGDQDEAETQIGFALRPTGQSYSYKTYSVSGVTGGITGVLTIGERGRLRLDTRASTLQIGQMNAAGTSISDINLSLSPLFWTHQGDWKTTGWGNLTLSGSVGPLSVRTSTAAKHRLALAGGTFQIGAARAQSGRMQLDYAIDASRVTGDVTGDRLRLSGNAGTTLVDMTQIATADLAGRTTFLGRNLVLPNGLRARLGQSMPQDLAELARDRFTGSGAFDYKIGQTGAQISLSGPLTLSGSSGARLNWANGSGPAPTIILKNRPDDTFEVKALASGQVQAQLPAYGNVGAKLDAVTFGPNGWAVIGRDVAYQSTVAFERRFGITAQAQLTRFSVSGSNSGAPNGTAQGVVNVIGRAGTPMAGQARLAFDGRASGNIYSANLSGPVTGFGLQNGVVNAGGTAVGSGGSWRVSGQGKVRATRFVQGALSAESPDLDVAATGNLGAQNRLQGQVNVKGRVGGFALNDDRAGFGARGVTLNGATSFSGTPAAVSFGGNLTALVADGGGAGLLVRQGLSTTTFSGATQNDGLTLRGNTSTSFAQVSRTTGPPSGRVSLDGARVSGPFALATGTARVPSPFWNDRLLVGGLRFGGDFQIAANRLSLADANITSLSASLPFSVSANNNGAWRTQGSLVATADSLAKADLRLTRARVSGPFSVQGSAQSLFGNATIAVTAQSLTRGDTSLSNIALTTPMTLRGAAGDLTVTGIATVTSRSLASGGTRIADIRAAGPFDARSFGQTLSAGGDFALSARSLTSGDTRLTGLTARAPARISADASGVLTVSAATCLPFSAQSGTFPGEARVNGTRGRLCPDARGRIAAFGGSKPVVFALPQLEPMTILLGGAETGQRIDLGEVTGGVSTRPNGTLALNMQATQFALTLKMPDGSDATIKASEAALDIVPRDGVVGLKGRIERVSSIGLPVLVTGGADANMTVGAFGLAGTFRFDDIILRDIEKSPRFGEVRFAGSGDLRGNQVAIQGDVIEPASQLKMANLVLTHDINTGSGRLAVDAEDMLMAPAPINGRAGLDVVTLIPPLRGVVLDMVGVVTARADIAWERDKPIDSSARVATQGVDFETLLGPVTALSGEVNFDDLLLVRTAGTQTIKIKELNTGGIPVQDGTIAFALPGDNSLRLETASWPFAEGKLSVRPATWAFRDGDQTFAIDVEDVDLAKLLRLTDVPNLEIDGKVSGVFPIEIKNGNVEIVGGRLRARDGGGMIRYTGPNPSPPPPPPGFWDRARQRFFGKPPPAGADLAIEALRALEYKILEITVDGRISGELQMGVVLEGANQQVLAGQPFKFNIRMNVPVGQILENLNRFNTMGNSPEVLRELDRILKEEEAAKAKPPAPTTPASPPTSPPPPPTF